MSGTEFLKTYRVLSQEIAMLDRQLLSAPLPYEDKAMTEHRTRELQRMKDESVRLREQMRAQFDQVVGLCTNARQRQVLKLYYGIPMTDQEIADALGCTCKAVNNLRNRFIHKNITVE